MQMDSNKHEENDDKKRVYGRNTMKTVIQERSYY
jgi:hypothetical protein